MYKYLLFAARMASLLLGIALLSGPLQAAQCSFMGSDKLLIGGGTSDAASRSAPLDVRYRYLAGEVRKEGVCQSACSAECGGWWGCWQDTKLPPGQYIKGHIKAAESATWTEGAHPQIPAITYYIWYQTMKPSSWCAPATNCEGAKEVAALNDEKLTKRFLDDWRFLLQTVGQSRALLHVEPDLWGYVRQVNIDPKKVPAQVKKGNSIDCANFDDNASGLAKCMISMSRKYAPNAAVGLHASPWTYMAKNDGVTTGNFMLELGAGLGHFIATDPSDRDAGFYETVKNQNRWWTNESAAAYLAWSKDLSDTMNLPNVMWQIPLGNMSLDNTKNRYKDNRVDYLFAHLDDVAKARVVALLFGAGNTEQTNPDTDGGNFLAKTTANWRQGSVALCSSGSSSSASSAPASASSSSARSSVASSSRPSSSAASSSRPSASSSSAISSSRASSSRATSSVASSSRPSASSSSANSSARSSSSKGSASSSVASVGGNVRASYKIGSDWGGGYCASLTVTNDGTAVVNPWRAVVTIEGKLSNAWNASATQTGDKVTFTSSGWNAKLDPGKSNNSVGFCVTRN